MSADSLSASADTVTALATIAEAGRDATVATVTLHSNVAGIAAPSAGVLSVLASAFFGAFFAFIFTQLGTWLAGRLKRGRAHRTALVKLGRLTTDYLNEILTNRRLAEASATAAASAHLYWKFPHAFDVDRMGTLDLVDLGMIRATIGMNTDLSRFNNDVSDLRRAHGDLQQAHLAGTIPALAWTEAMPRMAPLWRELAVALDHMEDTVTDLDVRANLMVRQYDSRAAKTLRAFGVIKTWPLDAASVEQERRQFDGERGRQLAESRRQRDALRERAHGETSPPSRE